MFYCLVLLPGMESETKDYNLDESLAEKYKVDFPEGLTEKDIELIVLQCEHQRATNQEQIMGMAEAYKEAKDLAHDLERLNKLTAEEVEELIHKWAVLIEPEKNKNGFRTVPVRFANGKTALDPELVDRAMENFFPAYAEGLMEAVEYYKEFEQIHPWLDGNGREGDLLWKIDVMRKTGAWPEELPPDVFEDNSSIGSPQEK